MRDRTQFYIESLRFARFHGNGRRVNGRIVAFFRDRDRSVRIARSGSDPNRPGAVFIGGRAGVHVGDPGSGDQLHAVAASVAAHRRASRHRRLARVTALRSIASFDDQIHACCLTKIKHDSIYRPHPIAQENQVVRLLRFVPHEYSERAASARCEIGESIAAVCVCSRHAPSHLIKPLSSESGSDSGSRATLAPGTGFLIGIADYARPGRRWPRRKERRLTVDSGSSEIDGGIFVTVPSVETHRCQVHSLFAMLGISRVFAWGNFVQVLKKQARLFEGRSGRSAERDVSPERRLYPPSHRDRRPAPLI